MKDLSLNELKVKFYDILQVEEFGEHMITEGPIFNENDTEFIERFKSRCLSKTLLIYVKVINGKYRITDVQYTLFKKYGCHIMDEHEPTILLVNKLKEILGVNKIIVHSDTLDANANTFTVYSSMI